MKKLVIFLLAVGVTLGAAVYLRAESSNNVKLISGEVVSLCNLLIDGYRGPEHKDASTFLVEKRGLPVAILEDGTDELYIAILKGKLPANDKLAPFMGMMVNAQGPVYEHGGVKLIEIQIVSEQ